MYVKSPHFFYGFFYLQEGSKVLYQAKDRKMEKTFDALEWLTSMTIHSQAKGNRCFVTIGLIVTSPVEKGVFNISFGNHQLQGRPIAAG
jgi:hypothetical protein